MKLCGVRLPKWNNLMSYLMLSTPFSPVCETGINKMDNRTKSVLIAVVMMATGMSVRAAQSDLTAAFKAASVDFKAEEGLK